MNNKDIVKVAAVQAAPVFLEKEATLQKALHLINQAAKMGAQLAVFPEAFLSGYPDWVWSVPNNQKSLLDDLYADLHASAVTVPGKTTEVLCEAAKKAGIHLVIGVNERNTEASGSSLYNTLIYIDSKGNLLGRHRKLIPTGGERLIWAGGDGSTMQAFDTEIGKIGGLICWENFMPLARNAMYQQGVQIYVAPTWDSSANWQQALQYIAREGGMFVIGCCTALPMSAIPDDLEFKQFYPEGREWVNKGNSGIIDPQGKYLTGPLTEKEDILIAELDLGEITRAKRMFDVAGHYYKAIDKN